MQILMWLVSLAGLVCWIMVLIPMFKENVLLGIAGILTCGIFAFIWGWVRVNQYGIKNLMIAWSVIVALNIVLTVMYGPAFGNSGV